MMNVNMKTFCKQEEKSSCRRSGLRSVSFIREKLRSIRAKVSAKLGCFGKQRPTPIPDESAFRKSMANMNNNWGQNVTEVEQPPIISHHDLKNHLSGHVGRMVALFESRCGNGVVRSGDGTSVPVETQAPVFIEGLLSPKKAMKALSKELCRDVLTTEKMGPQTYSRGQQEKKKPIMKRVAKKLERKVIVSHPPKAPHESDAQYLSNVFFVSARCRKNVPALQHAAAEELRAIILPVQIEVWCDVSITNFSDEHRPETPIKVVVELEGKWCAGTLHFVTKGAEVDLCVSAFQVRRGTDPCCWVQFENGFYRAYTFEKGDLRGTDLLGKTSRFIILEPQTVSATYDVWWRIKERKETGVVKAPYQFCSYSAEAMAMSRGVDHIPEGFGGGVTVFTHSYSMWAALQQDDLRREPFELQKLARKLRSVATETGLYLAWIPNTEMIEMKEDTT